MRGYSVALLILPLLCSTGTAVRTETHVQNQMMAVSSGMVIDGRYKLLRKRGSGPFGFGPTFVDSETFETNFVDSEPFFVTSETYGDGVTHLEGADEESFPDIAGKAEQKLLGRGAYGEAWLATDEQTNEEVVIKFLRYKRDYITTEDLEVLDLVMNLVLKAAENECTTAQTLIANSALDPKGAQHICKCRAAHLRDEAKPAQPLYVVQDSCGVDSFAGILQRPEEHTAITSTSNWELSVVADVLEGLVLMGKVGLVHHDLKGENIVVNSQGVAKIIDFGATVWKEDPERYSTSCSQVFKPPEASCRGLDGKPLFVEPIGSYDAYSMGIAMFQALCGIEELEDYPQGKCTKKASWDPNDKRTQALGLAHKLIATDPNQRPSPADASTELRKIISR